MSAMEGTEVYIILKIMFCFYGTGGCSLGEQLSYWLKEKKNEKQS